MGYDTLYLISEGICPGGGPCQLVYSAELDHVVVEMTDEIRAISKTTPPDLVSILHEPLALAAGGYDDSWMPPGLTKWHYFDICVAIGYFGVKSGRCEDLYHSQYTGGSGTRRA